MNEHQQRSCNPNGCRFDPSIRTVVKVPLVLAKDRTVPSEIYSFHGLRDGREHFAVQLGNPSGASPLVRLATASSSYGKHLRRRQAAEDTVLCSE